MTVIFSGLPASPGIGIGALFVYRPTHLSPETMAPVDAYSAGNEWQLFLTAQAEVDDELAHRSQTANSTLADIFDGQRAILHDKTLVEAIQTAIHDQGLDAATAIHRSISELVTLFRTMEDDYFASRASDILDVGQRLLAHLNQCEQPPVLQNLPRKTVLIAEDLTPSDMFHLAVDHVCAVALVHGSPTAHIAILARTLGLPLACALDSSILDITTDCTAIVDGNTGKLIVNPSAHEIEHYSQLSDYLHTQQQQALTAAHAPAITRDDVGVPVCANVNGSQEVLQALDQGADGIGLLRTEFLFMDRSTPPAVDEQHQLLADIAGLLENYIHERTADADEQASHSTAEPAEGQTTGAEAEGRGAMPMAPPLTVRLLDAGGDKPLSYIELKQTEANPFLGLRGVRLLLHHPDLLRVQLQAVVRLATRQQIRVRLMLPMVTTLDEVAQVRAALDEVCTAEEITPEAAANIRVGLLVEVPAAALMAEQFAEMVDFLSIGTNDLTQYVLACDRTNSTVAYLADSLHPAVLHLISVVCRAGRQAGIPVSVCGEIASDPTAAPLLLGLGVTELSLAPPAIPLVKQAIRRCDLPQCYQLAEQALRCSNSQAVRALLAQRR